MPKIMPTKDPNSVDKYHIVWCSKDGVNTGTAADKGDLQGATIATSTWTVTGATEDSSETAATIISGVSYAVNTVATIWLSGGTPGVTIVAHNRITTSDARTLDFTIHIPCAEL